MHRYSSFIVPAVLALLVSACGKDGTPEAPAKAAVAPDAKGLQLPAVQKQFLTVETVDAGAARAARDQAVTRLAAAESVHKRHVEMVEKGVGVESERQEA